MKKTGNLFDFIQTYKNCVDKHQEVEILNIKRTLEINKNNNVT